MRKSILVALFLLCLSSTLNASNKAELTIQSDKKSIIDSLTNVMISKNFSIKNINDYQAEYFKPVDDWRINAVYGGGSSLQSRVSYNFVNTQDGVKVIANMAIVKNPGTGFESVNDLSFDEPSKKDVMSVLNQLKSDLITSSAPSQPQ